jgi:indolepyruvate ferredoxin oxidoreductase
MFEGDFKLNYHLAPPHHREKERQGRAAKAAIWPGHADRPSGAGTAEGAARHGASTSLAVPKSAATERALIGEYKASMDEVLAFAECWPTTPLAVEIARIPEQIKGLRPCEGAQPQSAKLPAPGCFGLSARFCHPCFVEFACVYLFRFCPDCARCCCRG